MSAVWLARNFTSFQLALLVGIAAGLTTSYLLTKIFAFRSTSWRRTGTEVPRFLLVYGGGIAVYWVISVAAGIHVLPRYMPLRWAEMSGVLMGAAVMTVTSYFGHRFYTYRSQGRG